MEQVCLNINRKDYNMAIEKNRTLLYVLRRELEPTTTRCGCNTGDYDACKVIVDEEVVNSCLILARDAVGKAIKTVEGLPNEIHLHPIQQALTDVGATQCGCRIPGMTTSAKALLDKNPDPTKAEIRAGVSNNLCRCTGYVKIVGAVQLVVNQMQKKGK